ncbi:hypothetical protein [Deinococcus navajonensis]|uniref:Uncharacterized protein n=1 Tax=Deinococcus navajonensis TaxID=309884 RepID=A0ABV8XKS6_9DEIO
MFLLDEGTYAALPAPLRTALLQEQETYGRGLVERVENWQAQLSELGDPITDVDSALFVWWPSLWRRFSEVTRQTVLLTFVTADRLPHRGSELTPSHWAHIRQTLPGVEPLAGTFAPQSGPNCLSTVLAAFGVSSATDVWLHGGPFERWLRAMTVVSDAVDVLGTILVWRDAAGQVQHAAVALGAGWLFHKEAQTWWAPWQIVALPDALERWDEPGWHVSTHVLRR